MLININDKLWTNEERENIIKSASEKYDQAKWRVHLIHDEQLLAPHMSDEEESEEETTSDEEEAEFEEYWLV